MKIENQSKSHQIEIFALQLFIGANFRRDV